MHSLFQESITAKLKIKTVVEAVVWLLNNQLTAFKHIIAYKDMLKFIIVR